MEKNEEVFANEHDNDLIDEDEEEYYFGKINALAEEKFQAYVRGELNINDISSDDESTSNVSFDEQMESIGGSKRKDSSVAEVDNKSKKLKMVLVDSSDDVIRQLHEFIISDEINGSDIKLVIEKRMHARATQNWLNMPFMHLEAHDFLTPKEKQVLGDGSEIEVALVGPNLKMYKKPMSLNIGGYWKNKNYVLKDNWSDFVEANKNVMEEGAVIQVWSFRKDEQLCWFCCCMCGLTCGENNSLLRMHPLLVHH